MLYVSKLLFTAGAVTFSLVCCLLPLTSCSLLPASCHTQHAEMGETKIYGFPIFPSSESAIDLHGLSTIRKGAANTMRETRFRLCNLVPQEPASATQQ